MRTAGIGDSLSIAVLQLRRDRESPDMKRFHFTHSRNAWLDSPFLILALTLVLAAPALAQMGTSPWKNAVSMRQQAFTCTIARGVSLVAIVIAEDGEIHVARQHHS
jgi:hypothetical protein